ncbi:hypothetical protein [Sphingosinicella sp. BN140058]|uniref:hypothetical protein n=1 Tax=Sphingosinicella sp. BN140058 TaxID=1892855 RepID=UPI001012D2E1|nr:hypothetical protein [Sphingosinicella sp. BN140058]QAY75607.1 hypothetical protein ETR14_02990 [Sphingosinicella sp. BN140058]
MRLASIVMALAACCLGARHRDWAEAMATEFETAAEEGDALPFAAGCLLAALRALPSHEEGRLALASHVLALGLLIPVAALQLGDAVLGLPFLLPGENGARASLVPGSPEALLMAGALPAAALPPTMLLLLLAAGQMRIAWLLLERDWSRLLPTAMAIVASASTLVLFMSILFLESVHAVLQLALLALELATVAAIANWHTGIIARASPDASY